jgi:hypothetical protein
MPRLMMSATGVVARLMPVEIIWHTLILFKLLLPRELVTFGEFLNRFQGSSHVDFFLE